MLFFKRNIAVSNLLLALVMAAFVGVPLVGAFWSGASPIESRVEKRPLAGLPAWPQNFAEWMRFPKAFRDYAHDRFGFRDDLLDGYRWMMTSVFHESTSSRAFVGRDGWLYYTGNGSLADMQGTSPYSDTALHNAVEQINARGELLAVRGIRYGFVVFPDKHTVYPQFLPHGLYAGFASRRLNAFDAAMAKTGHHYYFDASRALRRDATHAPFQLYYKSDTHWNPWGAYLGYEAWVDADGSWLGLRPFRYRFDQFRIPHRSASGDLAKMSGYHPHDPDIYPPSRAGCESGMAWHVPDAMLQRLGIIPSHMRTAECHGHGTALIVHDSFMDSIERYVDSNFKRSWMVWRYVDDRNFGWLVDKLHPDTVLVERVERLMSTFPKTDLDTLVRELGIVGESATINARGELILDDGKRVKTLARESVAGSLQRVVRGDWHVYVGGWVRTGASGPSVVIAVADGKVVGEAPITLYRPDVATANHDTGLTWSGFRMNLPAKVSVNAVSGLRLYLVGFGSYAAFPIDGRQQARLFDAWQKGPKVIGQPVAIGGDGRLALGDGGPGRTRTSASVGGSLDQIERQGKYLRLVGWARLGRSPPAAVIAVADGRAVAEVPVNLRRSDVAAALGDRELMSSGFAMDLPVAALGSGVDRLHLYFIDPDSYGAFTMTARDRQKLQAALR